MASARSTVTIVVDAVVFVYAGAVVCKMATRTIRLVGRCRPDDDFRIIGMAFRAVEVARVIQRFVPQADMLVNIGKPRVRRVALVALAACDEVTRVLARRRIAVVAR